MIDGGDNHGYLVAARAANLAVTKARRKGFAVVGAHNTQITGNFAHYIEKATRAGLIVADRYDAAVVREAATVPLASATRRKRTLAFARRAGRRIINLLDPEAQQGFCSGLCCSVP